MVFVQDYDVHKACCLSKSSTDIIFLLPISVGTLGGADCMPLKTSSLNHLDKALSLLGDCLALLSGVGTLGTENIDQRGVHGDCPNVMQILRL